MPPAKLNPESKAKLLAALRAGNTRSTACACASIEEASFNRWAKRGNFRAAVLQAEAEAEISALKVWQSQIPNDWRAAERFLVRRFPGRWSNEQDVLSALEQRLPAELYRKVLEVVAEVRGEAAGEDGEAEPDAPAGPRRLDS